MDINLSVLMVIAPADNPNWFAASLASILQQTIKPSEIILVLNGPVSTEIQQKISLYANNILIKILQLPNQVEPALALQEGIAGTTSQLVAIADVKDIATSERLEKQLKAFFMDKQLAILGSAIAEFDATTNRAKHTIKMPLSHEQIKKVLKHSPPFNPTTVMFKKKIVLEAGNYRPYYNLDSYYLWGRCAYYGYKMGNLEEPLVIVRANLPRMSGYQYFYARKQLSKRFVELRLISPFKHYFNCLTFFIKYALLDMQ